MFYPSPASPPEVQFSQNFAESEEQTLPPFDIPAKFTGRVRVELVVNSIDTSPNANAGLLGHWMRDVIADVRRLDDGPIAFLIAPRYDTAKDDIATGHYAIAATLVISANGAGLAVKFTGIPNKKLFLDGSVTMRGRIADGDG